MTPEAQRKAIAEACGVNWDISSLDAMHEAEKVLTHAQLWEYHHRLHELKDMAGNNHWRTFHATAAQRAEAFLLTLNLWKDDQ